MDNVFTMNMPKDITQLTFIDIYTRLMLLAQSVYEWKGLPHGMDEKYIERFLFHDGRCMFFKDFEKGWMVARCTDGGLLNYYDEPTRLIPVAANYCPMTTKAYEVGEDCVYIQNNDYAIPTRRSIMLYAARLAEMQRTIDINIHAMKTPIIVKCNPNQRLSLENAMKQYSDNSVKIVVDRTLEVEEIKVLNTAAPIVFDKLALEKSRFWNEVMTFLGVNNANQDKRERLVDDEVQANNEQIQLSAELALKARKTAAKAMSELTGTNITVSRRTLRTAENGQLRLDSGGDEE